MRKPSVSTASWFLLAAVWVAPASALAARRVILISVDGLRPDAIAVADTPTLDGLIAGGAYSAFALCDLPPATLPNHTTMVTGVYARTHGVIFNVEVEGFLDRQTIFSIAHHAGLTCGFFTNKSKLKFLAPPAFFDHRLIADDADSMNAAVVTALAALPPDLLFVHYKDTDSAGHESGWMSDAYLEAVERIDALIGEVVDALGDLGLLDETAILVTADHGGLGTIQAPNVPEVRYIPWIACGAGIVHGRTLCDFIDQPDTPATVLALLGLPVPEDFEGQVVESALTHVPQEVCEPVAPFVGLPCVLLMGPLVMVAVLGLQARAKQFRSTL